MVAVRFVWILRLCTSGCEWNVMTHVVVNCFAFFMSNVSVLRFFPCDSGCERFSLVVWTHCFIFYFPTGGSGIIQTRSIPGIIQHWSFFPSISDVLLCIGNFHWLKLSKKTAHFCHFRKKSRTKLNIAFSCQHIVTTWSVSLCTVRFWVVWFWCECWQICLCGPNVGPRWQKMICPSEIAQRF